MLAWQLLSDVRLHVVGLLCLELQRTGCELQQQRILVSQALGWLGAARIVKVPSVHSLPVGAATRAG